MWILCGEAVAYRILYYRKFLLSSQVICIGSAYFLQKLSSVVLRNRYALNYKMHAQNYNLQIDVEKCIICVRKCIKNEWKSCNLVLTMN